MSLLILISISPDEPETKDDFFPPLTVCVCVASGVMPQCVTVYSVGS